MQPIYVACVKGNNGNVLSFSGKNSNIMLPYMEIGCDYTISFQIRPSANNPRDASIFKSPAAILKLKQGTTRKLGFSTDLYNFDFDYVIPENRWTYIVITGTERGISLHVNGKFQKKLYNSHVPLIDKGDTNLYTPAFVFPLQTVGGFCGEIDKLRIWNKALTGSAIRKLAANPAFS